MRRVRAPHSVPLPPRLLPKLAQERALEPRVKGARQLFRKKQGFRIPQSIRECMTRDEKLIWDCSPRQLWLATSESLYLQPPTTLVYRGPDDGPPFFSSLSLSGLARICKTLRTKGNERTGKKDAYPTSKLGVSSC